MRRLLFHGTSKDNADAILESGYFRKYTHFADNLADAIGYGGEYVFAVWFDIDCGEDWQFRFDENISTSRVRQLVRYTETTILDVPPLCRDCEFNVEQSSCTAGLSPLLLSVEDNTKRMDKCSHWYANAQRKQVERWQQEQAEQTSSAEENKQC